MVAFATFADLEAVCLDLPAGDYAAAEAAQLRQAALTKPLRSLGRLEEVIAFPFDRA